MSIIIKSDQKSSSSLGNIYGLKGESDYALMLDFSRQDYILKDVNGVTRLDIEDAVVTKRSTQATYKKSDGSTALAEINEPRIHYMQDLSATGLLIERATTNLLTNPYAPQTQTVTLPVESDRTLILSVEGTGSATLSGTLIVDPNRVSATQDYPQAVAVSTSTATDRNVTITVTGSITSFQLELVASTQGGGAATTITSNGISNRAADNISLSPTFSYLLNNDVTILYNYALSERLSPKNHTSALINMSRIRVGGTAKREILQTVSFNSYASNAAIKTAKLSILNSTGALLSAPEVIIPSNRKLTFAYTASKVGSNLILGASGTSKAGTGDNHNENFTELLLSKDGTVCGVLTHLVIYPRILTAQEIEKVTTSWL